MRVLKEDTMAAERTAACKAKLDRMSKPLRHQGPDRVAISDSFRVVSFNWAWVQEPAPAPE